MVEISPMKPSEVASAVRELDHLACSLRIPAHERCDILGLTQSAYHLWQSGLYGVIGPAAPELVRRLSYALPLLRRMAAHDAPVDMGCATQPSYSIFD